MCGVALLLNIGLFSWAPAPTRTVLVWMQYDRQAVVDGQLWRLLTGNLVHWSPQHFFLDVFVFLVLGFVYEHQQRCLHSAVILTSALAVGVTCLAGLPGMAFYRGLSAVDWGLFVMALTLEAERVRPPRRWVWLAALVAVFLKILYEYLTDASVFPTAALGRMGAPSPLVHAAGAGAGLACMAVWWFAPSRFSRCVRRSQS